jgi:hypothetical protein
MDTFEKLSEDNEYVKQILEHSKHWLQGKKLTTFNIMELVTKLIPYTQKVMSEKGLGPMKKKVIMSVLLTLTEKLNFTNEDERKQIQTVIEETVPSSIDLMIDISKGDINFEKIGVEIIKQGGIYSKLFSSCCGNKEVKKDDNKTASKVSTL